MTLSLRRNSGSEYVGLDVDGSYLAVAQLSGGTLQRAVSRDLEHGVVEEGDVKDPEALGEALKDFFRNERLPRRVRLGVANQQILVRHLDMPVIDDRKERDAAVRFQTAEAVAMPLEEAVIDYQVVGETHAADGGRRSRVMVVAARKAMVERLAQAVRSAGLRPEGIDLSAFALVRALASGAPTESVTRVYCHLGGVANLAVASGSNCHFARPLATRWDDGAGDVESLGEELQLSIDHYRTQSEAPAAEDLVLSGPGARNDGVAEAIGSLVRMRVSVADPLGAIAAPALGDHEDPFRHMVSVGLAMGAAA